MLKIGFATRIAQRVVFLTKKGVIYEESSKKYPISERSKNNKRRVVEQVTSLQIFDHCDENWITTTIETRRAVNFLQNEHYTRVVRKDTVTKIDILLSFFNNVVQIHW